MYEVDLGTRRSLGRVSRRGRKRIGFELLERRALLSTYTVTNTLDDGSTGSLPWAISEVNQDTTDKSSQPDVIDFDISGNGFQSITLSSALPEITNPVVIDGATQSGQGSYTGAPLIAITCTSQLSTSAILSVGASSSTIEGLAITGSPGAGILLTDSSQDLIQDCYVGTFNGTSASGNDVGIQVEGASSNTISGNLISGNRQDGIDLESNSFATLIQDNVIGLNAAATALLGNGGDGVDQNGAASNTIGGIAGTTGNIISGNNGDGIYLGTGNDTLVEGNFIGTNGAGTAALGNGQAGVLFANASYATIGGTIKGTGNLLSGNEGSGIDCFVLGSGNELIEGNLVGVDVTGTHALGNGNHGIRIAGPLDCTIGGTTAAAANVIGANAGDGINLNIGPSNGSVIEGNFIGTDVSGTLNLGNNGAGIFIGSDQVTIGGTSTGEGNVIADNQQGGVAFGGGLDQDSILSNSIYDNSEFGISFNNSSTPTPNHQDEEGFSLPQANDYQNYPVLTSVGSQGTTTEIVGSLNAGVDTTYLIQFFASPTADSSGYGQGQVYLGSTTVTTGSNSDANDVNFDVTLPTGVAPGWVVSATATDPLGNTSEFSQDIAVVPEGDVGVSIAASPTSAVYAEGTLTYTLTVSSNGPDAANGVVVTDTLPDAIGSNVIATTSVTGETPAVGGGIVTADLGTMAANTTATVTIVVQLTGAAVPQVSDTASVTTTDEDTNPSNNSAQLTTTVSPSADLAITIAENPNPVYIGSPVTYVLTVTNNGPSEATAVAVTDTLPQDIGSTVTATTTFSGVTPVIAGGLVNTDISTLASGATGTITITVQPLPTAVPQISDSASITSETYDPDPSNNTPPPVTTVVDGISDLQVGITGGSSPVPAGQDVTYTITATNNGPSDASDVVVTDDLPEGVGFVSATGGAEPVSGVLTLIVGDLAANSSTTYQVTVQTSEATASPMNDQVSITGGQYDPDPLNNTASLSLPVVPSSRLSITLAGPPNPVDVGSNVSYSITATNSGAVADPDAVVVDTLPADVTFVSASDDVTPVDRVLTFDLGDLATNATANLTIVVHPTADAGGSVSGSITDEAVINGQVNANSDNTASATSTVEAVTGLAFQLSAAQTQGYAGQDVNYTITATNEGPSGATGVVVSDALPSDISSDVTATTSVAGVTPTISDGRVEATFGDLALGATVTMTISVIPSQASVTDSPLIDDAYISDDQVDPDSGTATVSTPIDPAVDLDVTQFTAGTSSIEFGDDLTYTAVITNNGPSPATGVTLTAPLSTNATFVAGSFAPSIGSVSPAGLVSQSGANLVANIGDLAVGASETVTFEISPGPDAIGSFTSSVTATSSEYDIDPANSTAQTTITVLDRPGTLQFGAINYQVPDTAGSAAITLVRSDGTLGQVSVTFSTYTLTATAGLDYQPTTETVVFPAGATSETVQVPVLDDPYGDQNELVGLSLSSPAGGAVLAGANTATLTIQDVNPNTTLPQVTGLQWTGSAQSISSLVLSLNQPLATGPANNLSNYSLVDIGRDGIFGTGDDSTVPISSATYNASNWTVTLVPGAPLSLDQFYHISVNGTPANGITNIAGAELAGAGPSLAGTDYTAMFGQGTKLEYVDTSQNKVTLTIKKGGFLDAVLVGAGQTGQLDVVGAVPHHTVVSGTVKKAKHRSQSPLVYAIYGLGQSGKVRVKTKAPTFKITQYPFSPSAPGQQTATAAVRLDSASTSTNALAAVEGPRCIKHVGVRVPGQGHVDSRYKAVVRVENHPSSGRPFQRSRP
jgi:uncharacterized repeat protein (TIGR01451 family)